MVNTSKIIKTYMNFSSELDPAKILSMADLELSVALATPLVTFDEQRQIAAGLAERWEILPPNKVKFTLRKNLKWSDGTPVTAMEYKAALNRARSKYPDDLKALFDSVSSIEADSVNTLTFTTKGNAIKSGLLLKLTEPMYGLVATKDGNLDLTKSAGPFVLSERTSDHIVMTTNLNWSFYSPQMPTRVEVRQAQQGRGTVETFANDEWPNLISGSSLMTSHLSEVIHKQGYKTWQRTLDKVFSLYPTRKFLDKGGNDFVRLLSQKLDRQVMLAGVSGYALADQFFPRGYELWSQHDFRNMKSGSPSTFKSVKIILPESPVSELLRNNIKTSIEHTMEVTVACEIVPLQKLNDRMQAQDYDLLATGIAVADPNFEGAMSFFIEKEPAFIPSTQQLDLAAQSKHARSLSTTEERAAEMRKIIIKAQEAGHVLPLFHFSSLAIAKQGIDLSEVPNSDETVLFSKVRFQ